MADPFLEGAKLFLDAQGVKDTQERTRLLGELQKQQMQNERFKQYEMMEKISQQQTPVSKFSTPEMAPVPFGEQFITPPESPLGAVTQPTGRTTLSPETPMWAVPMMDKALGLMNPPGIKPDMSMTEPEYLALSPGDPRRRNYISGKMELQTQSQKPQPNYYKTSDEAIASIKPPTGYEVTADLTNYGWQPKVVPKPSNIFIGQTPTGDITSMSSRGTPTITTTPAPPGGLGPKVMSEDYRKDVTALNQASDIVGQLERLWKDIGVTSRASGMQAYGESLGGYNVPAKTYLNMKSGFLGNLSRSIAAERGVLTQQDIERIDKMLARIGPNPMTTDNATEATSRWTEIKTILSNAENRMRQRHLMTPSNPTGQGSTTGGGTTKFIINGRTYNIPNELVPQFKKEKGIR